MNVLEWNKVTHSLKKMIVVEYRSWINASRVSDEYDNDVEKFLQFSLQNERDINGRYYCPLINCLNKIRLEIQLIREHVLCDSFLKSYTTWTRHGDVVDLPYVSQCQYSNLHFENHMEYMISAIGQVIF